MLQSPGMGSQRVGHDLATEQQLCLNQDGLGYSTALVTCRSGDSIGQLTSTWGLSISSCFYLWLCQPNVRLHIRDSRRARLENPAEAFLCLLRIWSFHFL